MIEIRQELESLGVKTDLFIEKIEIIDALMKAWKQCSMMTNYWLHRLRETGLPDIFDAFDDRPFTLDQLYEFCNVFFLEDNSGHKCMARKTQIYLMYELGVLFCHFNT